MDANITPEFAISSWGKDNDSERHWSEKDYEALSLLYRHDVERYLNSINSYVDKDLQVQLPQTYRKGKKKKDTALFSPEQEVHSLAKKHTERSNLDPSLASIRNRQSSIFSSSGHGKSSNPQTYQRPSQVTNTRTMKELFGERKKHHKSKKRVNHVSDSDPSDSSSSSSSSSSEDSDSEDSSSEDEETHGRQIGKHHGSPKKSASNAHFDFKLRPEIVSEWDGNPDNLAVWILKINALSKRSSLINKQLGQLIPTRLRKEAETLVLFSP